MTAWTKGLDSAPKKKQILVRHKKWNCPVVMKRCPIRHAYGTAWAWELCEDAVRAVTRDLRSDEIVECEWMEIPE